MSMLPPSVRNATQRHNICLILEGFEEKAYFDKLLEFPIFPKDVYNINLINAKSASRIPTFYQAEYSRNSYEVVLAVCDKDRTPEQYNGVVAGIDEILGPGKAAEVITFSCPCTLQIILLHFGDVRLTTQAKKAARTDVERLTGVSSYDAHAQQLEEICKKIHCRSYAIMKERVSKLSTNPEEIPSTNILTLLNRLESRDPSWINQQNSRLSCGLD